MYAKKYLIAPNYYLSIAQQKERHLKSTRLSERSLA